MPPSLRASAAAVLVLLASCASTPVFRPDPDARAPHLRGFGTSDIAVTTRSPRARELFNQGVLQAYAFNEVEAIRLFKTALTHDWDCAMCAWGVAWQLGPNINNPDRDNVPEALQYVGYALARLEGATPRERALVEALAVRYGHKSQERATAPFTGFACGQPKAEGTADPLDKAYADAMRKLADRYPGDADILSLYAEAEMVATDGEHMWSRDGKPAGRMGEVADRLQAALPAHPRHTGVNHYMIHAVDAQAVAARAVEAADRLGALAPASPHLVHMPAHIYVQVGRYREAAKVNELAVAADNDLAQAQKAQGFEVSKDWRGHDLHFLWYAALMSGRGDLALSASDQLAQMAVTWNNTFAEYLRSMRLLSLVRMEAWDRVLAEPLPKGDKGVAQAWYEHSRGIAQARTGRIGEARQSLARLKEQAAKVRSAYNQDKPSQRNLRSMMDYAEAALAAQLAAAQNDFNAAIDSQRKAMDAAAGVDSREPPVLADGTRPALGDLQARAGQWKDSEATFREALREHPASGWALRGLHRALAAQGRAEEAARVQRELQESWSQADAHLLRT